MHIGEILNKFKARFEWYTFALPRRYKVYFDRIMDKASDDKLRAMPGDYMNVIVLNQLIDMKEGIQRLEY